MLASSSDEGSDVVSDPDTDDSSSEAERIRSKLRRRAKARIQREKKEAVTKAAMDALEKEPIKTRLQRMSHGYRTAKQFVKRKFEPHQEKVKKIRKALKQAVTVAEIRTRKIYLKYFGELDEIQREMYQELRLQYVAYQVEMARDKATREFSCIESVRKTWGGLALEVPFIQ